MGKPPLEYYEAKCMWVKEPTRADSLTHVMDCMAFISGINKIHLYTKQVDFNSWEVWTNNPHDYKIGIIECKDIDK